MNFRRNLVWTMCAVLLAVAAAAADSPEPGFEQWAQRLKLTPDQQSQIRPLFEARNTQLRAIRDKYSGDGSRSAKRSAMREAKSAQNDFNEKLKPPLSSDQRAELDKMHAEAREKMKEKWQARQGKSGT